MGTLTGYNKVFRYDQSGRLIYESKTSQYYGEGSGTEKIVYLYDESGIIGMMHTTESGTTSSYYFQRNLLGDVIGIYNTSGIKVGGYAYDAWGNCTITLNTNNIATKNPIRYRGYYYDEESGLYYLNARYYSPTWRRFISPDDTAYLDTENPNGLNLYTYCNNDPVNYADPSGHMAFFVATAIGCALIGLGWAAYSDYTADGIWFNGSVGTYIGYTLCGAVIGATIGLAAASLLAGTFVASCAQVYMGLNGLAWALTLGGPGAAGLYMINNLLNSIHVNAPWLGYYPPNNGFSGSTETITLQSGTILQRFGGTGGSYVAPYYTAPMSLSLPYAQLPNMNNPQLYILNQSLEVTAGTAAPWFGQYGGGTQYLLPQAIRELLELGIISKYP